MDTKHRKHIDLGEVIRPIKAYSDPISPYFDNLKG